jgi:hypothetical protein
MGQELLYNSAFCTKTAPLTSKVMFYINGGFLHKKAGII